MPYAYKDKTCWGSCVKTIFPSETKCKREELIQSLGGYSVPSVAIGLIHPFQQDYKYLQALWNVHILPQFCLISCKYVFVINLAGEQSDQPLHESRANLLPFPPLFMTSPNWKSTYGVQDRQQNAKGGILARHCFKPSFNYPPPITNQLGPPAL